MTEMIERVANELLAHAEFSWMDIKNYEFAMIAARAVIEVMREPTENMATNGLDAIDGSWNGRKDVADANSSSLCWKAMIDAVLGEHSTSEA